MERVQTCAWDMLLFGRTYLPHYFGDNSAAFHPDLCNLLVKMDPMEWWKTEVNPDYDLAKPTEPIFSDDDVPDNVIDFVNHPRRKKLDPHTKQPSRKAGIVVAAPRGHAKSTLLTLLIPVYCACYRLRTFIVIVSDADVQVRSFCSDIKREFEENETIRSDFGDLVGSSYGRKWTGEDFMVCHAAPDDAGRMRVVFEMRIAGRSTGSKMRGLRNRASRPDLVICDDIENDTHVESDQMREALYKKVVSVFVPALDPHTGVLLFCGTILHFDSVLSRLLGEIDKEGQNIYVTRLWAATVDSVDVRDDRAIPIWPERFNLTFLREKQIQLKAQFNKEYMNNPHDPETRDFLPQWVRWWHMSDLKMLKNGEILFKRPQDPDDDELQVGPYEHRREKKRPTNWQKLGISQSVDPAISKSQRADFFTLAVGGCSERTEDVLLLWLVRDRLNFAEQLREINSMAVTFPRTRCIAIEATAYQDALYQVASAHMAKKLERNRIPFKPLRQKTGANTKEARLRRRAIEVEHGCVWLRCLRPGDVGYEDAPWDETGTIKVHPNHFPLYQEMMQFPNGQHDDALDCLDMLMAVMGRTLIFSEFAEREQKAAAGNVPTTRTKGPRANVPGEDPNWREEAA